MAMVKGMVIGGGVAALATGSYFVATSLSYQPTTLDALSAKSEYNGKIGQDYAHFLVAPFEEGNQSWWNSSYGRWQKDSADPDGKNKLSDEFKDKNKIAKAFKAKTTSVTQSEGAAGKALNEVCEDIYKKQSTEVAATGKENLKNNLWQYCSVLGAAPSTIDGNKGTETYGSGKIGEAKKADLMAAKGEVNGRFWQIKDIWFRGLTATESEDAHFKKYMEGENKHSKSIRDICLEAYASNATGAPAPSPTEAATVKFCSSKTHYSQ